MPADSTRTHLEDVIERIRLLPPRTWVLVKRGNLTLNSGERLRRNKAVEIFSFMCTVLDVVAENYVEETTHRSAGAFDN